MGHRRSWKEVVRILGERCTLRDARVTVLFEPEDPRVARAMVRLAKDMLWDMRLDWRFSV